MANSNSASLRLNRCLLELAQLRQELNQKLTERAWSVDKIVIERLQTDKVELNLGSIDVRELSGMLSIGFNYGCRLIKTDSKGSGKTTQQPVENQVRQKNPTIQQDAMPTGEGDAQWPGTRKPVTPCQPGEPRTEAKATARARPHLTINFK
jgi:hypothetical protein